MGKKLRNPHLPYLLLYLSVVVLALIKNHTYTAIAFFPAVLARFYRAIRWELDKKALERCMNYGEC